MCASVFIWLLCRFRGYAKNESTSISYLSTQRFRCNKSVCSDLSWVDLKMIYTFVFDVIFFTFFCLFFTFYIYHIIFSSNCLLLLKFQSLSSPYSEAIETIQKKNAGRKWNFIIYLQTKSYLWIFNAVWTFRFFVLFRSNVKYVDAIVLAQVLDKRNLVCTFLSKYKQKWSGGG